MISLFIKSSHVVQSNFESKSVMASWADTEDFPTPPLPERDQKMYLRLPLSYYEDGDRGDVHFVFIIIMVMVLITNKSLKFPYIFIITFS